MTTRWRPRSVRVRLALWYAGSLAVLLALYGAGVFAFLRQTLSSELDARLHDDFELAEQMLERHSGGEIGWRAASHEEAEEHDSEGWVDVRSLDGKLLYQSQAFRKVGGEEIASQLPPDRLGYASLATPDGRPVRVLSRSYSIDGTPVVIRVVRSEEAIRHELRELLLVLCLGFVLTVGISALGGYFLARRALLPVSKMADRARTITAESLGERLPVVNPDDELGYLARVFNETFARLERSFNQLRRSTADASHELRTPLTAIRAVGEVGLREPRDENAYREIIGSMLEEVDRLGRLVEELLTLSRADAGHVKLNEERVDLGALAKEVRDHLGVLAEEKRQTIVAESTGQVITKVDRLVLRQALINLVDNAIKYSPERATIRISVGAEDSMVFVEVIDAGTGIPLEHQKAIFERFYRVDKARSRESGGTGLGLSITRWAVEAHGGRIELESEEGKGSRFRIVLPGPEGNTLVEHDQKVKRDS